MTDRPAATAGKPNTEYIAYPNDRAMQEAWQHGREYGMGEITAALAEDAIEAEATPPSLDVEVAQVERWEAAYRMFRDNPNMPSITPFDWLRLRYGPLPEEPNDD